MGNSLCKLSSLINGFSENNNARSVVRIRQSAILVGFLDFTNLEIYCTR
jgi:hypothetical protein